MAEQKEETLNLALYHAWIHNRGGGEKVLLELLKNSKHQITIYTHKYKPEDTYEEFQNHNIQEIGGIPLIGEILKGAIFSISATLTKIPLKKHDALIVSTGGIAELINYRNTEKPIIGYCHTPLRPVHDQKIIQHKKNTQNTLKNIIYSIARKTYKKLEKPAWNRFKHVIFNSQNTRERATKAQLIHIDKTSVINPGANTKGNKPGKYEKYFFYPSRFAYYKRQDLAIDAYQKFRENNPNTEFKLVIAGGVNEDKQKYYEKIKEKAQKVEGVKVKKNVPGKEWEELYQNCYAVLFCAINEDWGITPIEAGSYEKPVISVNEGGPTESLLHDQTGLLVEDKPEKIAKAMQQLANNEIKAQEMGKKGKQNTKKYTWNKFTKKFDNKITKIIENSSK